jgi:hypothetical protein
MGPVPAKQAAGQARRVRRRDGRDAVRAENIRDCGHEWPDVKHMFDDVGHDDRIEETLLESGRFDRTGDDPVLPKLFAGECRRVFGQFHTVHIPSAFPGRLKEKSRGTAYIEDAPLCGKIAFDHVQLVVKGRLFHQFRGIAVSIHAPRVVVAPVIQADYLFRVRPGMQEDETAVSASVETLGMLVELQTAGGVADGAGRYVVVTGSCHWIIAAF